jgi:hypothetical protein
LLAPAQVGDGARDFQDPVLRAGRRRHLLP